MSALDKIKEPIAKDIIEFQSEFKLALNSDVKMINSISGYLVKNRGKTKTNFDSTLLKALWRAY